MSSFAATGDAAAPVPPAFPLDPPARARAALVRSLAEEQGWVRVHAAEALIAIGEGARVRAAYERELPILEAGPTRVGAWRVLAATAGSPTERAAWVEKIARVFTAPGSADRLQAVESLCKLRASISGTVLADVTVMRDGPEPERPLGNWALHLSGDREAIGRLSALLGAGDPVVRLRAAYALRWIGTVDTAVLATLAATVDAEPADSLARPYLLSAALALDAAPGRREAWLRAASGILETGAPGARYELSQTLGARLPRADAGRQAEISERSTGDERIGAALLAWTLSRLPSP